MTRECVAIRRELLDYDHAAHVVAESEKKTNESGAVCAAGKDTRRA